MAFGAPFVLAPYRSIDAQIHSPGLFQRYPGRDRFAGDHRLLYDMESASGWKGSVVGSQRHLAKRSRRRVERFWNLSTRRSRILRQ